MPSNFAEYARRIAIQARKADTTPTDAQREAMNHAAGHVHIHGFNITICNPKGSLRKSKKNNRQYLMHAHYGYIRRTTSSDGEQLDVYIGEHPESQLVFVIDQLDDEGNFEEYKCVMGCRNYQEAKKLYLSHHPEGWEDKHLGEVRGYTTSQFREWLKKEKLLKKSASVMGTPNATTSLPQSPTSSGASTA